MGALTKNHIADKLYNYYLGANDDELTKQGREIKNYLNSISYKKDFFLKRIDTILNAFDKGMNSCIKLDILNYNEQNVLDLFKYLIEATFKIQSDNQLAIGSRKYVSMYIDRIDLDSDIDQYNNILNRISSNSSNNTYYVHDVMRKELLVMYRNEIWEMITNLKVSPEFYFQSFLKNYLEANSNCTDEYIFEKNIFGQLPKSVGCIINAIVENKNIHNNAKRRVLYLYNIIAMLYSIDKYNYPEFDMQDFLIIRWNLWNSLWQFIYQQLCFGISNPECSFNRCVMYNLDEYIDKHLEVPSFKCKELVRDLTIYFNIQIAIRHCEDELNKIVSKPEDYIIIDSKDFYDERMDGKSINTILGNNDLKKRYKEMCESGRAPQKMETFKKQIIGVCTFILNFNKATGRKLDYNDYRTVRAVFRAFYVNKQRINRRFTKKISDELLLSKLQDLKYEDYIHVGSLINEQMREEYCITSESLKNVFRKYNNISYSILAKYMIKIDNTDSSKILEEFDMNMLELMVILFKSYI